MQTLDIESKWSSETYLSRGTSWCLGRICADKRCRYKGKNSSTYIIQTYSIPECNLSLLEDELLLTDSGGSDSKESVCNAGDMGSIPGLRRSPEEGNGNSLQCSCLENPMDREVWPAVVHSCKESDTTEWLILTPVRPYCFILSTNQYLYIGKTAELMKQALCSLTWFRTGGIMTVCFCPAGLSMPENFLSIE